MHIQKEDEHTIIRTEQEQKQKRTTRPRKKINIIHDISLGILKISYEQGLIDIEEYQRTFWTVLPTMLILIKNNFNDIYFSLK
jgi:hypothetical protein